MKETNEKMCHKVTISNAPKMVTMEELEGFVDICCHRVRWTYDTENLIFTENNVKEITDRLEKHAEERAKEMIILGNNGGELNCLIDDSEVRGWWEIE